MSYHKQLHGKTLRVVAYESFKNSFLIYKRKSKEIFMFNECLVTLELATYKSGHEETSSLWGKSYYNNDIDN